MTVLPNQVSKGFAEGAYESRDQHVHLHIDGGELTSVVQKRSIQNERRTGHNGMSRRMR